MKSEESPRFEDNLKELEELVRKMESGGVSLDEMIASFEKGRELVEKCRKDLDDMTQKLEKARDLLPMVTASDDIVDAVVSVTIHFGIDGHRADITMLKAAKANAALEGRTEVTKDDIRATAELVLAHRLKRRPFEDAGLDREELEGCLQSL